MKYKSVIFGIKSYSLTKKEKIFLKKNTPWGVILFSRNIKNLLQLKNLVTEIKNIFKNNNYPILIDQEGGRVSRLDPILDLSVFTQRNFGNLYNKNKLQFNTYYQIYINATSDILKYVGININTVPVLDVIKNKKNIIIGDRSFSLNPRIVKRLGIICSELYQKNKIAVMPKHIPGHGSSTVDSHFDLPIVNKKKKKLIKSDFYPFFNLQSFFVMTGHVLFSDYDSMHTATHSQIIINDIIRKKLNFTGILITDDISMKSLKFDLVTNVKKAFNAGCDIVLHCNGNLKEMEQISKVVPFIDSHVQKKTSQFNEFLR